MKRIIILVLVIVFSFFSCTDNEHMINNNGIKSLLVGKWQATYIDGGGSPDLTKDSHFLCFTENSYYEFYKKDSLTHRDVFGIKFDKSIYNNDSNWFVIFKGIPSLEEDSSSSTGYRTINEIYAEIVKFNDSNMELLWVFNTVRYVKIR